MTFTFINLVKFGKKLKKPISELTFEEKIYYFLHFSPNISEEDLKQLTKDEPIIERMVEIVAQHFWTENELFYYEQEQKREWDNNAMILGALEKGEKQGIKKGIQKGKKQAIQELIEKGLITQEVAQKYDQLAAY